MIDSLPNLVQGTHVQILGNKEIIIDGCDGVINYNENSVSVKSNRLKITIEGENMRIKTLSDKDISLKGFIKSVNYEYI